MVFQDTCYQYWLPNDSAEHYVEIVSEREETGYISRIFRISSGRDVDNLYTVAQYQVTDWAEDGIVREPRTIIQVIDEVIRRQQKIGGGPIVVHCR